MRGGQLFTATAKLSLRGRYDCRFLIFSPGFKKCKSHSGRAGDYSLGCFFTTLGSFFSFAEAVSAPDDASDPGACLCNFGFGRRRPKVPRWIFPRLLR